MEKLVNFFRWFASRLVNKRIAKIAKDHGFNELSFPYTLRQKYITRSAWVAFIVGLLSFSAIISIYVYAPYSGLSELVEMYERMKAHYTQAVFIILLFATAVSLVFMGEAVKESLPSDGDLIDVYTQINDELIGAANNRKEEEHKAKLAAEEAARKIKQAEDEAYRKRLQEIEDVEAAKARGQAKGMAELYRHQIELLVEYKKRGADIDKEVFDMREKLLVMERQENNFMIQDLLKTLDSI